MTHYRFYAYLIFTILYHQLAIATESVKGILDEQQQPTKLEVLVVTQFEQFCMDNANNFENARKIAKTLGFVEEKNEHVKTEAEDNRWIIHQDNSTLTRMNLVLKNKSCMISAITGEKNIIHEGEDQTPIEHYLMNELGAELVKRSKSPEEEIRIFDSNFQGKTATITLQKRIIPSKVKEGTYYYEIVLTSYPYHGTQQHSQ